MGTRDVAEPIHRNSLKPGYRLLWYRIETVLGQGGFGITYLAHDTNLDREVAIKEYMPDGLAVREPDGSVQPASDARAERFQWGLDRFMAEARTLDRFEHPNIVRVRAVFDANGTGYMVMEYEHGDSLKTVLADCRTMDEGEISRIVLPLLGGLEKVHERGFIHRDIKPANIMIREDGSPVLIDFGSARQALGATRRTLTVVVSPGYAPFEQYFGKSDQQGPWTDIYGLGATLYRAVTDKRPEDAAERGRAILEGAPDPLENVRMLGRGRYSAPFLEAIDHSLRFRHQDRPQTVAEWRREFGIRPDKRPHLEPHHNAAMIPADEPRNAPVPPKPPAAARRPVSDVRPPAAERGHVPAERSVSPLTRRNRFASALGLLAVTVAGVVALRSYLDPDTPPGTAYTDPPTANGESRGALKGQKIATLLSQAEADLEALRLTTPAGRNALEKYREVLALEPDNAAAKRGLVAVADRFVGLARQATAAGDFDRASDHLRQAEAIASDAPGIVPAKNELALRKAEKEREATEARAKREQVDAALRATDAALAKDDAPAVRARLEEARKAGAEPAVLDERRRLLRTRLETLSAAAASEAKQALQKNDTVAARAALERARDLKTQTEAIDAAR